MKKTLTLLLTVLFSMSLFAKSVDLESAKKVGINFFYERSLRISPVDYKDLKASAVFTVSGINSPVYYIIDLDGKGWVVVAAEDAVTPVLAYSFAGSYSGENKPPQFVAWMDGYVRQIEYSLDNRLTASQEVSQEWERLSVNDPAGLNKSYRDVAPLLLSTWDQGNPYNMFCPEDGAGPGGHVWAGCVATAMCQVMYYYRWPNVGNGEHCYTPWGYDQQCADFGATTYNWEEMMNSHAGSQDTDTAMATLLWHAGISVDMMYAPDGSGAYSQDAAAAMINNFRYTPNTQLLNKDDYSESVWAGILRDNIDKKRPMYYHGFGSGGHAFNVDGYQGSDFFHFNWGWSGSYNGYYYLTNLNPGGSNFTEGQGAIVNLYPDTVNNTYPENCSGQMVLDAIAGTVDDGSGPSGNYISNINCSWLISPQTISDSISSITISFNRFSTEEGNDVVRVYQGGTTSDLLVGEFSGENIPSAVTVNSNKALVTFSSNGGVEKGGWYLTYVANSIDWCEGITTLTEPEGTISDGSYGFNYKNKSSCRWKIVPENTGGVILTFTAFNTEQVNDVLKIYDMGSGELIGEISGEYTDGNMPGPFTASSGKMYLMWNTSEMLTAPGWEGFYSTFPVGTQELTELASIRVYPNPATEFITIDGKDLGSPSLRMELMNTGGKVLMNKVILVENGVVQEKISLTGLPKGLYILKFISDTEVTLKKVVTR
jgi:hypothetical protein